MKTKAQFICAGILLATLLNCSGQPIITRLDELQYVSTRDAHDHTAPT